MGNRAIATEPMTGNVHSQETNTLLPAGLAGGMVCNRRVHRIFANRKRFMTAVKSCHERRLSECL